MNDQKPLKQWISQSVYYIVILIISLVTLFFFPLFGTTIGLVWVWPATAAGWTVYIIKNLFSAFLNLLLFHSFVKQGKLNITFNENYLKANELLLKENINSVPKPLSPRKWHLKQYSHKGLMIILVTLGGSIGLTQAILAWSTIAFLAQLITVLSGLVFGFIAMKSTEEYYTVEYLEYAKMAVEEKKAAIDAELKQTTKGENYDRIQQLNSPQS